MSSKKRKRNKKHSRLNRFLVFLLVILLLAGFWWFENNTLHIQKTTVTSAKVTESIRIVQISDLHGAQFGPDNRRLIRNISELKPDLIFVTGDMFTNGDTAGMDTAIRLISTLCDLSPVYFVPGEHDQDKQYLAALSAANVHVMCYQTDTFELKGTSVCIYGIDNQYYSDTFDLHHEFASPDPDSLNLLLAHIPNYDDFMEFGADITFSGDTHGGVVQIPLLGPMYFEGQWFPELINGRTNVTDRGLFSDGEGHSLYVSAGLGNYPYPLR